MTETRILVAMEPSASNEPATPAVAGGSGTSQNPLVAAPTQVPAPNQPPTAPTPADDLVWVEKARQVIRRSSGDPFVRHDALTKLKLQYLKQRYGKTIGENNG